MYSVKHNKRKSLNTHRNVLHSKPQTATKNTFTFHTHKNILHCSQVQYWKVSTMYFHSICGILTLSTLSSGMTERITIIHGTTIFLLYISFLHKVSTDSICLCLSMKHSQLNNIRSVDSWLSSIDNAFWLEAALYTIAIDGLYSNSIWV